MICECGLHAKKSAELFHILFLFDMRGMPMKWYSDLYVGEKLQSTYRKHIRRIEQTGKPYGDYLIALPANPANLLDIMPVKTARYYADVRVIGIAKDKQEAIEVAASVVDDVYHNTGGFDVKAYLKEKEKNKAEQPAELIV